MAKPDQEAVEMFMSITGVSLGVALQKLGDHNGNLQKAINAHFSEGDRDVIHSTPVIPHNDVMGIVESINILAKNMSPSSLLDPTTCTNHDYPREVREIPIEVKDSHENSGHSGLSPTIEDISEYVQVHDPEIQGTTIDQENDEDNQAASYAKVCKLGARKRVPSGSASQKYRRGKDIGDFSDYTNDIEKEMLQAAIEKILEPKGKVQLSQPTTAENSAEQEEALHHMGDKTGRSLMASNRRLEVGRSSSKDAMDHPLVWQRTVHRSRTASSRRSRKIREAKVDMTQSAEQSFPKWGRISYLEHDEAVMLVAERSNYRSTQNDLHKDQSFYPQRARRSPSPGIASKRLIQEQQDDEFHPSLQSDKEKELRAMEETEAHHLEQTVKEAAIDTSRQKEEELCKRLDEEQEMEKQLAVKESSLPSEPMADDENVVTLLVRMPDGSCHGRRFLKSDNLQSLFDFIDVRRVVKPGCFRLVRPWPLRRTFSNGECRLSLHELGLTGKQEALFLEMI